MALPHKVMLLGEVGVGKSSLVQSLVFGTLKSRSYKATVGVDVYTHTMELPASGPAACGGCQLVIWDVDGDLGEGLKGHAYIRGSAGALILADVTRPSTFESMLGLARMFSEEFPGRPIVCVGNKTDLVPDPAGIIAPPPLKGVGIPFVTTSALTGERVDDAFKSMAALILERGL